MISPMKIALRVAGNVFGIVAVLHLLRVITSVNLVFCKFEGKQ